MKHEIKIEKQYFEAVIARDKTFEIRYNDRDYNVGDKIVLEEIDENKEYTGRSAVGFITYLTDFMQQEDYVVFSFSIF